MCSVHLAFFSNCHYCMSIFSSYWVFSLKYNICDDKPNIWVVIYLGGAFCGFQSFVLLEIMVNVLIHQSLSAFLIISNYFLHLKCRLVSWLNLTSIFRPPSLCWVLHCAWGCKRGGWGLERKLQNKELWNLERITLSFLTSWAFNYEMSQRVSVSECWARKFGFSSSSDGKLLKVWERKRKLHNYQEWSFGKLLPILQDPNQMSPSLWSCLTLRKSKSPRLSEQNSCLVHFCISTPSTESSILEWWWWWWCW